MKFQWDNEPERYEITDNRITMSAKQDTNLFNSMGSSYKCNNFPYYYTEYEGDFLIRCKVSVNFANLYDLGSIVVYGDEDRWIKLAYENSDTGHPAIVSIVTNITSDDCNGEKVEGSVWLQIMRKDNVFALHYSKDKVAWSLVRIFRLELAHKVKVGVSAQCPIGKSCNVRFEGLEVIENPYEDMRRMK